MNPELWKKLEDLFQAAVEAAPEERTAFVAEACGSDDVLRRELESLLRHHDQSESFIESPAYELAAESILDGNGETLIGKTLGSYEIVSQLGKGGMGVVYLANDNRLPRKVALKFLPADLTGDQNRIQRFKQEARTASALNHPNILTIFEIEESEGQHYIATEFVEGATLRELLEAGRLSLQTSLDAAIQIASALSAAHASGIVHRDIKPENIMRRADGYIKVLDFGLAKLIEPGRAESETLPALDTGHGVIVGTLHYMSPEQIRHLELDERTDLWSLGVVIYEMFAGQSPFKAPTEGDVVASILQKKPSFEWHFPNVPPELGWILKKALAKDKEERYQTAKDLLIDLTRLRRELEVGAELGGGFETIAGGAGGKLSSASIRSVDQGKKTSRALSGSARRSSSANRRRSRGAISSLAVIPLVNAGGDPSAEYLSDGITENIINNLSQLPNLRVMARSTVFRYKGNEVDPREAGRELGVRAVLTGRVLQLDDSLVISTELVHVSDGTQLWGQHYNRKLGDIFAIQEEIAQQISENLRIQLSREEKQRLTRRDTQNAEAYQLYLKGRYHWIKRSRPAVEKAIEFFQKAIEVDPNYALAYAGLADSYIILAFDGLLAPGVAMPKAKNAAKKALEIDETLAEAHTSLAFITWSYDWNWQDAEKQYREAQRLNPNYPIAHHWHGIYLAIIGRFEEAAAELSRACELDPLSLNINTAVGLVLHLARRDDEATEQLQRTLEMDSSYPLGHFCLGLVYVQKSMFHEAIQEFKQSMPVIDGNPRAVAMLACAEALAGERDQAQALLEELKEYSRREYLPPYLLALIWIGFGDYDQAFACLEEGCDVRDPGLVWIKVEPMADALRADPRFETLLRRIDFPSH